MPSQSSEARDLGVDYFPNYERSGFLKDLDVVVLSVPLIDVQSAIESLPVNALAGKLVVVVSPLNAYTRDIALKTFANQPDIDILVTNTMFGLLPKKSNGETLSETAMANAWDGSTMVYERIRVSNVRRCDQYLKTFEESHCQIMEMDSDQHDRSTADAEFVTHMVGRLIDRSLLPPTAVMSKEYEALNEVVELTAGESFDRFFGMYKFNERAKGYVLGMRENLASLERKLAAREAYLAAKAEMKTNDRRRLLAETRLLLQDIVKSGSAISELQEASPTTGPPPTSAKSTASGDATTSNKNKK